MFWKNQSTAWHAETVMPPMFHYNGVFPTMGWGASIGFPTNGDEDVRGDKFVLGFLWME